MVYVDGFVIVVKKKKLSAYLKDARIAAKAWKKHGALEYIECVGDDLKPNTKGMKMLGFPKMTKKKPDELVFFSYIVYRNKKHRESVNKKVMKEFSEMGEDMPFDVKRMAWGGFKSLVK